MSLLNNITRGPIARPHFIGLYGVGGVGKCLGKGTKVMRHDGTVDAVENIMTGDLLMGPDGLPKTVLGTTRGVGPLYRAECNKGDSFVCNDAHLLTVSLNGRNTAWHEISAEDFSKIPEVKRKYYCGVRASVEFPAQDLPLDPYFVGLWIGDGTLRTTSISITKPESEIHAAVCAQAEAYGLHGKRYDSADKCGRSSIIGYERGESTKPFPEKFKNAMMEIGWNRTEKTIPHCYMASSRSQRLQLLAGLIDTDGHMVHSCFEISTKYEGLANSILWVARSLGFQATSRLKVSTIKELGFSGSYHRIFISGNTDEIPTRNPKKKATPRGQVKDPSRFGMKVVPIGEGEYFGFEVDGDHRFLLGDFTVTHNSSFAAAAPKPIFIGTDDGTGTMDVARFPILETWQQAIAAIDTLENEKHEFETAVFDTVNGLEPLLWSFLCKEARCNSIEEIDGGFGKGYVRATEQWVEFFKRLKRLRNKMNVIGLGHSLVKTVEDVIEGERYDRYLLKMHQQSAATFHEAVDCMFFANFQTSFRKEKGAKKSKASGEGRRVMYTEERPGFLAKSRFDLPSEMELSWDEFAKRAAVAKTSASVDELAAVFEGIETEATAYLVSIGWLVDGQSLTDLKEVKRKNIRNKRADFIAAVKNHAAELSAPSTDE